MTQTEKQIRSVCVFCASSTKADIAYYQSAQALGKLLASHNIAIKYGGGSGGLMGSLADGALSEGGEVIGIIPDFMADLEWGHENLTVLQVVKSMHERKALMRENTDAIIALPGGTGTLEELLEVITLKRLGIYNNPIILINTKNFYDNFLSLFDHLIKENFMNSEHRQIFSVVENQENTIQEIKDAPTWRHDSRHFAIV